MAATVFAGIFGVGGIISIIVALTAIPKMKAGRYSGDKGAVNYARRWVVIAGAVAAVIIAPVIFFGSGFSSVPTKSVGVITSYGKVIGQPYGPGSHWLVPWKTLNIVQDTIQSDNFAQANGNGADEQTASGIKGYCVQVRLAGMSQGCLDVQMQTQVDPSAIPELYGNYASYGSNLTLDVDEFVVQRELKTWLNRPPLSDYNVIQDVSNSLAACAASGQTGCTANVNSQFSQFDPVILQDLRNDPELKGKISILDVNLQSPHFDPNTEAAISKIQTAYLETVEAIQQEKTNAAISAANAALTTGKNGQSLTPAVLQYDCYQTTQDAVKANYTLPAGWNCSGSSGSNLILPAK